MVYVHVPSHSPRAQELTRRLRTTIEDYRAEDAKLTQSEIELAVQAILPGSASSRRRKNLIGSAVAIAGASFLVAFGMVMSARENGRPVPIIPMAALAAVGTVIAVLLLLRANND
jgi:hypothetical protein